MKIPSAFQVYLLLPFMVLISLWTMSGRWFLNGNIRALVFLLIMTLTLPIGSQYGGHQHLLCEETCITDGNKSSNSPCSMGNKAFH